MNEVDKNITTSGATNDAGKNMNKPNNTGKKQDTKFKPGVSGNPAGRPKGSRNWTTEMDEIVEELAIKNNISFQEAKKEILKRVYMEARQGNFNFYKEWAERYYGKVPDKIEHSGEIETKTTIPERAMKIIEADLKKKRTE